MSRLIDRGRALLVRAAQQSAGVSSLIYTQVSTGHTVNLGPTTTDTFGQAWVGRTVFKSNLEGHASIQWGDRDYLIPEEALTFGGVAFLPARGDQLTETLDGISQTFQIITPDTGEQAWRWSDPQHTILRVHTKQVS